MGRNSDIFKANSSTLGVIHGTVGTLVSHRCLDEGLSGGTLVSGDLWYFDGTLCGVVVSFGGGGWAESTSHWRVGISKVGVVVSSLLAHPLQLPF